MPRSSSRKQQIMDTALSCFTHAGYYRTSLDEIAATVGVTKAGIYYHFKSKKELFIALFNDRANAFFDQLLARIQQQPETVTRIQHLFGPSNELMPADISIMQFCMEFMTVSTRDPEIRREVSVFYRDKVDRLVAIIRDGIAHGIFRGLDPESVARNLYFQSWGYFLINFTINDDFDPELQHRTNLQIFLHGLLQPDCEEG